jgi:hypothetical protein
MAAAPSPQTHERKTGTPLGVPVFLVGVAANRFAGN